jgi:hypothetical protein
MAQDICGICGKDLALVGRTHHCIPRVLTAAPRAVEAPQAAVDERQSKPFLLTLPADMEAGVERYRIAKGMKSRAAAIRALLAIALTAIAAGASAQQPSSTTTLYGPNGQYLGTVNTIGPYTNIYGPQGQWLGMATTVGPTPWPVGPVVPAVPMLPTLPALPAWGQ